MTLTARTRQADPLHGRNPEALLAPELEAPARHPAGSEVRTSPKRRRATATLASAAAVAVVAVALVALVASNRDHRPQPLASLAILNSAGQPASAELASRTAAILHERLVTSGLHQASLTRSGTEVTLSCSGCTPELRDAVMTLAQPGRLAIYDWEASVLAADCAPAPRNQSVTGGPAAGQPYGADLSYFSAVQRASRCSQLGSDAASHRSSAYYALSSQAHRVLAGPLSSRQLAQRAAPGAAIVTVGSGAVLVEALYAHPPSDSNAARWFVLRDDPALTTAQVADARAGQDDAAGGTGAPVVLFDLTASGRRKFQQLTAELARRGKAATPPAGNPPDAFQHFAIVLDGRLLEVPYTNYAQNPSGFSGRGGVKIEGGFTPASARAIAAVLRSGTLAGEVQRLNKSSRGV